MKLKFEKIFTISNGFSFLRLLLVIPLIFLLESLATNSFTGAKWWTASLLLFAALTDLLDGYLARKFDQVTEFGKLIDPLADKVFIIVLVLLLYYYELIDTTYLVVIVLRDVIIFTGGVLVSKHVGKILPSNLLGKITVLTIAFYLLFIVMDVRQFSTITMILYYVSLLMSFLSVIGYGIRAYDYLKWNKNEVL